MVAMHDIQELSDRIASEFCPDRIILFGSHARGEAGDDSDVDLLVIMAYKGRPARKAAEILNRTDARIPIDLLVRSRKEVEKRLALQDWFMHDIMEQGKVLYEATDPRVGTKGGGRLRHRRSRTPRA